MPDHGVTPVERHRELQDAEETSIPETCDAAVQVGHQSNNCYVQVPRWLVWVLGGIVVIVIGDLLMGYVVSQLEPRFTVSPELMEDMGVQGVILFRQHDRNSDGVLDIEEFEPLAHRLIDVNETYDYEIPIEEWDQMITIQTSFQPLNLNSMSIETPINVVGHLNSLIGLKEWKKPMLESKLFGASHFAPFMPPSSVGLDAVGQVYPIYKLPQFIEKGTVLSSNRFMPPLLQEEGAILIHRLLSLFHPKPFVLSRFAPQGAYAVVRANSVHYIDITFRIHAEFQLNEPPCHPFWFTPAQFTGHLIINKDGNKLQDFHLYVPNDKKLNVDMEWLNGPKEMENMEVDIGFLPKMELHLAEEVIAETQKINWTSEISLEEAKERLERAFYPFKQVPYYNLTESLRLAESSQKLIHCILLWGVLDDQSC